MAEFSIRSDAVDVEQIMRQIRARIREKRGADYTEKEIRELANAKLETFLDPSRVRSGLLEQFRANRRASEPAPFPNYAFEDDTIFQTHRSVIRFIRRLLQPILKLFFNPNPLAEALHIQAQINSRMAEINTRRDSIEELHYELIHNLVVEITRLGIEVKNMKMKVESVAARLDFDERRGRALEGSVLYRSSQAPAPQPSREAPAEAGGNGAVQETGIAAERRRRRRRRGRRRGTGGEPGEQAVNNTNAQAETAPAESQPAGQAAPEQSGETESPTNEPES